MQKSFLKDSFAEIFLLTCKTFHYMESSKYTKSKTKKIETQREIDAKYKTEQKYKRV